MDRDSESSKGCLLVAGAIFALNSIVTSIGLIFHGEKYLNDYTDYESGSTNLGYLTTTFCVFIIALIYFIYTRVKSSKNK